MNSLSRTRLFTAICVLLASANVLGQNIDPRALAADPASAKAAIAPRLSGLGNYAKVVTTDSADSQYFFNQGLRLAYGFNHSEALRAFKEAARLDPDNAMAYWGWALVLGQNLNLPMQPEAVPQAYDAIQKAVALKDRVSGREAAFITALASRYSRDDKNRAELNQAYARAMKKLHNKYPADLDAATLYGASLMNLSPWNYWHRDGMPYERTEVFIRVFESVLAGQADHPGALHYYIHAVEAQQPEKGEVAADTLRRLMPGVGHMLHMPSHIYMRLGRYADAYQDNIDAAKADERYIAECRAQGLYPVGYYPHNVHFLVWAAMLQGRSAAAIATATKMHDEMPEFLQLKGDVPAAVAGDGWKIHEHFMSQRLYSLARFARWDDILDEPRPPATARFMNGVWHYARGLAFARTGALDKARAEQDALSALRDEEGFEEYWINASLAADLLQVAEEILAGEIAAVQKDYSAAVSHLEYAVRLADGLAYTEPPDWYFPPRHYLGAVLLEAGRPKEAETVYWADLQQTPHNGYALFGLMQAMRAQGNEDGAAAIESRFANAWANADIKLQSSRF